MRKTRFIHLVLASVLLFGSCNPEEAIPSFVYIKPYVVETSDQQGKNSSKITEAWVYADKELLGAFSLPAHVPVLKEGDVELLLDPGIRDNGQGSTPEIYPFYERIVVNRELKAGETDTLAPKVGYKTNTVFELIEDFESTSFQQFNQAITGKGITVVTDSAANRVGKISLDANNLYVLVATNLYYSLPENGTPVYLELDYRNSARFTIGVSGLRNGIPEYYYSVVINKRDKWNKIYINLSPAISDNLFGQYRITIQSDLSEGQASGEVFLDNIKLLHF